MLPSSVIQRIQALLSQAGEKASLRTARTELTRRYRNPPISKAPARGFASSVEIGAYIAARMPATFAAVEAVLAFVPLPHVTSVLDMGAGPGTAALAAALHWPQGKRFHLLEENGSMCQASQHLLGELPEIAHQQFSFEQVNLLTFQASFSYDLVILSYVMTELSPVEQRQVLQKAWERASQGLMIVAPGTPSSFRQLLLWRDWLIDAGAFIAAPCPHHQACPLKDGDWCHFSTRLARPAFHRDIKDASLPYEDEKYSYLVALRKSVARPSSRLIRNPLKRSGHVTLDLCAPEGARRQTVSRRDGALYRRATHLTWGDGWEVVSQEERPL